MNRLIKFLSYDFKCLLKEHYIIDSYQYIHSTFYKLNSVSVNLKAIENLVSDKKLLIKAEMEEQLTTLQNNQFYDFKFDEDEDNVSFFGISLDRYYVYNKLFSDIYSNLHSFFDVFAQYLNLSFLGNDSLTNRLSIKNLCNKFANLNEYIGQFPTTLSTLLDDERFKYIEDLNNTCKHRFQILSKSHQNLLSGEYKISIPSFTKDGRNYSEKDLISYTKELLSFCVDLFYDSLVYLENFLRNNNHLRTLGRIYNMKTALKFNNKEDFSNTNFKPSRFEVYIEIDTSKNQLLNSYSIMFMKDSAEDEKIEIYNCPYKDILVKDTNNNIIGILTLPDSKNPTPLNELPKRFVTYNFINSPDSPLIHTHILDVEKSYYPALSDCQAIIINK